MTEQMTATPDAILAAGNALPWAYVRSLSSLYLGPTPADVDLSTLLEARFFSEEKEIRLLKQDGQLLAYQVTNGKDEEVLAEESSLSETFRPFTELKILKYISYDEDGQAYISESRFAALKEG